MKTSWIAMGMLCAVFIGIALPATSNSTSKANTISAICSGGTVDIFQGKWGIYIVFPSPSSPTIRLIDDKGKEVFLRELPLNSSDYFIAYDEFQQGDYTLLVEINTDKFTFAIKN